MGIIGIVDYGITNFVEFNTLVGFLEGRVYIRIVFPEDGEIGIYVDLDVREK